MTPKESADLEARNPQWVKSGLFRKAPQFALSTFESRPGIPVVHQPKRIKIPEEHVMDDSCPLGPFKIIGNYVLGGFTPPQSGSFLFTIAHANSQWPFCAYQGIETVIGPDVVGLECYLQQGGVGGAYSLQIRKHEPAGLNDPIVSIATTTQNTPRTDGLPIGSYADCNSGTFEDFYTDIIVS